MSIAVECRLKGQLKAGWPELLLPFACVGHCSCVLNGMCFVLRRSSSPASWAHTTHERNSRLILALAVLSAATIQMLGC